MFRDVFPSDGQLISSQLDFDLFWSTTSEIQLSLKFVVVCFLFQSFYALDYERAAILGNA